MSTQLPWIISIENLVKINLLGVIVIKRDVLTKVKSLAERNLSSWTQNNNAIRNNFFNIWKAVGTIKTHTVTVLDALKNPKRAQSLSYGLEKRGIVVRFPVKGKRFSLLQRVRTGYGVHPASYSVHTEGKGQGSPSGARLKNWRRYTSTTRKFSWRTRSTLLLLDIRWTETKKATSMSPL